MCATARMTSTHGQEKCRLADSEDELKDPEDLLSDDDDVERSSPAEVLAWVGAHERKGS